MPTQKELNAEVVRTVATSAFWRAEVFCRHFADDFTMDIPTAPVGMPNHYSTWEAERCFEWLNRSVRSWHSEMLTLYPTPNPDTFWVHGHQGGEVFWGEHDGSLETDFFMRVELRNGKVSYLSWRFHAWAWLLAAGRRYHGHVLSLPVRADGTVDDYNAGFVVDTSDPEIQAYLADPRFGQIPVGVDDASLDASPAAVAERRQVNVYQFAAGVDRESYREREVLAPGYRKGAFFVGDPYPVEGSVADADNDPALFAWNKVCSPWMYRDPRSRFWATDDPCVFFVEMNAHGPGCWRANGVTVGHYKQDYLVRLTLDDLGRLVSFEEVANPVNGLNSTAAQIDNFPYYH